MLRLSFLALVVNTLLLFSFGLSATYARSAPPRPLKRIDHPSTLSIDILPRTRPDLSAGSALTHRSTTQRHPTSGSNPRELLPTDAFRLTLSAFGDTFHLHLAPNDLLLHPDATVSHFRPGPDGRAVRYATIPLAEHMRKVGLRAYAGEVVPAEHTARRMREDTAGVLRRFEPPSRGWARIVVHSTGNADKGIAPSFEGAFAADGVVHHVATRDAYARRKHPRDPGLVPGADPLDSGLVVWRETDVMSELEARDSSSSSEEQERDARAPAAHTCAHDALPFNTNPFANRAIRRRILDVPNDDGGEDDGEDGPWYDPLGLFGESSARNATARLGARDDVQTGDSQMSDNFADVIGDTTGCPKEQRIVYTGVAADCSYTRRYGSVENATTQILNNWNSASDLFKRSFNVSLGIIDLQLHDPQCPKTTDPETPWNVDCGSLTLNDRLSLFSAWRGKRGDDGAGLWHLLSNCPTGTEVGIAWLGTLCQQTTFQSGGASVSGTAVSTAGRTEWQVIAHETGHNFGAIHDCADGCKNGDMCCPLSGAQCSANAGFIMSPVATDSEQKFSLCSLGNVCSLMTGSPTGGGGFTNQSCLIDPKLNLRKVISLSQCGNGIVEEGEDCDPGPNGNSTCCDKRTCKFAQGAKCDPASSPCCTGQCQFAPATTMCRPSKDAFCDTPEMCTGNSSSCPTDVFKPNGQSCGSNGLSCANGVCTSLDKQCQQVGSSLGLQKACPQADTSCRVSCQDPKSDRQCITLQTALVDGSSCGYGGTCNAGKCVEGPLLDRAKSWFVANKHISIPIAVVAGVLVLLFLWGILRAVFNCCSSSRKQAEPPLQARWQGPPATARPLSGPQPPRYSQSLQPQQQPLQRANSTNVRMGVPGAPPAPPMQTYQPPSQHFAYQQQAYPEGSWQAFPRPGSPPDRQAGAMPNPWGQR